MIVTVPALRPDTSPETLFTDARVGILLLQTPPVGVELSVVRLPAQTSFAPIKEAGVIFTVSSRVL